MALNVCDAPRCNARAIVDWLNDHGMILTYCGHCSDAHADAMTRAEWAQVEDERDAWAEAHSTANAVS